MATTGILGVALYLRAEQAARAQALESNRLILSQLDRSVNAVLSEFDKTFASLILDFTTVGFLDYYRERDYLMMGRVYQRLYDFLAVNRSVNSLHIYYRDADLVLSPHRGVTPADSFYDRELIQRVLAGTQETGWLDVRMVPDVASERPVRVLTVVKPIPLVYYAPKALIIVTLREQFLSEMIASIQAPSGGSILIVSRSGEVLGRTPDPREVAIAASVSSTAGADEGTTILTGSGAGRSLVSSLPSRRYPWVYVYALPYREVVAWIEGLRAWWLAAILAMVLLGGAASLVISRASYTAVSGLASRLARGSPQSGTPDLLGYIGESIDALARRASDAEALLEGAKPGLRNAFLLRLLKGGAENRDLVAERFDYYGLRAHTFPWTAVLLVRPDEADAFRNRYTEHEKNLLSVRFLPLVASVLPEGAAADVLDDDPMEMRIVLGLPAEQAGQETVPACARSLRERAAQLLDHPVTVGVSESHRGIADLQLAYREAARAIQYRVVLGGNRVIVHAELPSLAHTPFEYPFPEERKLLDCLKNGDLAAAERQLDRFLPASSETPDTRPQRMPFVEIQLLCSVMSLFSEIGGTAALNSEGDLFSGLLAQSSSGTAKAWFLALFGRIGAFIEKSRSERTANLVRGVEEYVRSNYQSRELSLVRIADAVYYSVPHVCRVFRDVTGVSVKELINKVRIDRAKELLHDPDLTVSDVAHKVGYDQLQSFIKLFKKRLGLTPGDYRRLRCAPASATRGMLRK